jgi:hypothetical protein
MGDTQPNNSFIAAQALRTIDLLMDYLQTSHLTGFTGFRPVVVYLG